jgi:hypothetical protein
MIQFGTLQSSARALNAQVEARIYRHSDGYPDGPSGIAAEFERFFTAVEHDTDDHRYSDAEYLAAKFLVWAVLAAKRAEGYAWRKANPPKKDGPLNFLGYGVSQADHGDVAYVYFVDCGGVTWKPGSAYTVRPKVYVRGWDDVAFKPFKLDAKAKAALKKERLANASEGARVSRASAARRSCA